MGHSLNGNDLKLTEDVTVALPINRHGTSFFLLKKHSCNSHNDMTLTIDRLQRILLKSYGNSSVQ